MVLNDLLAEYLFVKNILDPCNGYFIACEELINEYFVAISQSANAYFKLTSVTEGNKNDLINKLSTAYTSSYNKITKIITLSFPFYGAMAKLESHVFANDLLSASIKEFLKYGHAVMDATNNVITAQLPGMKTQMLLPDLINPLQQLTKTYNTLCNLYSHLQNADEIIMEELPEEILSSPEYNSIEIRSYQQNISLSEYSKDLSLLSSFVNQFEILQKNGNISPKIYLRKIESGSLRVVFGSNTIELNSISDIIRAITDGIRIFRLTSVEKESIKEKNREHKLQNDSKELAIINSQIDAICNNIGLSKDNPEDIEKIQKLCLPLVRYINNNPVGKVGSYNYDLTHDLKLLEDFYYKSE